MRSKVVALCLGIAAVYLLLQEAHGSPHIAGNTEGAEETQASLPEAFGARSGSTARSAVESTKTSNSGTAGYAGSKAEAVREAEELEAYDDDETVWGQGLHEDHAVYASEPKQQFWQWRRVLADEVPDPAWAEQLRRDLTRRAHTGMLADAKFHQIDCRETICQLYLQTDQPAGAEALVAAMRQDRLEIEQQEMTAHFQLEGASRDGITYELVFRRDRPAWMPSHVPGAGPAYRAALDAPEETE
jgi:hypothetical protein